MGKMSTNKKMMQKILLVLLSAITMYYIYQSFNLIRSIVNVVQINGFKFYSKFPLVLITGILKYIVGTLLLIFMSLNQYPKIFGDKKDNMTLLVIITSILLVASIIAEIMIYFSFKKMMGSLSVLLYLRSLLTVSGIINAAILLFFIFYLIYSIIKGVKISKE